MMRQLIIAGLLAIWGVVGLLAWVGCDDPVDLCDPAVPGGTIMGRVRTGGLPLEAIVTATALDRTFETRQEFKAELDETGTFAMEVPHGRYTIELRTDDGHGYYADGRASDGSTGQDTVVVDGTTPIPDVNFDLGSVTLVLELPGYLFGQPGNLELHRFEDGEWAWSGRLETRARTEIVDGQLELTVVGVLPGQYKVEVGLGCQSRSCRDFEDGERFWLPGVHNPDAATLYTVSPDSLLEIRSSLEGEPSRIEGRVTGAWLAMGVRYEPVVSIVAADSGMTLREIRTDPDGGFSTGFLVSGPVKLLVTHGEIEAWIGGPAFADATVFHLEDGRAITGIEYAQCGIHVVLDSNGMGGGRSTILIFDRNDGSLVARKDDWDTGSRHTAITNLWPGEFLIQLMPESWRLGQTAWRPQWYDRAATSEQAQVVVLATEGEVARLDVVLERGGEISGRIVWDPEAEYYYNIEVFEAGQDTSWSEGHYYGQEGYHLTGLPDGDYVIGLTAYNFPNPTVGPVWYPGTYERSEAVVLEIRDAAVLEGMDIVIPSPDPATETAP